MVKLNIIVEGGVPLNNVSADTANNVESLRQSLHKFFSRALGRNDVEITVLMGWNYRMATRRYLDGGQDDCLYVDSDMPGQMLLSWFDRLINKTDPEKTITIPDEKKSHIFFMIQEMEAWFLKQPDSLERWAKNNGYQREHENEKIAEHSLINKKNIEDISKPSEKPSIIIRHYFSKDKKCARYGKLKTAPQLLDELDTNQLTVCNTELQRFRSSF